MEGRRRGGGGTCAITLDDVEDKPAHLLIRLALPPVSDDDRQLFSGPPGAGACAEGLGCDVSTRRFAEIGFASSAVDFSHDLIGSSFWEQGETRRENSNE